MLGPILLVVSWLLAGCQPEVSETYTVNYDDINTKITFKAKGDRVTQQIAESQLTYDVLAVLNEEQARKKIAERRAVYQGIDGLEYDVQYGQEMVTEIITLNYTKDNLAGLAEVEGLFVSSQDVKNAISLKGTTAMMVKNGAIKTSPE